MSTHVFDARFFLRTGSMPEIERLLVSLGAVGGEGMWWLFNPEYNKIDLCVNEARVDETDERARALCIEWPPVASGHVYIKGTNEENSLRHFVALLAAMTDRFQGVAARAREEAGARSIFSAAELRTGENARGMTVRELVD